MLASVMLDIYPLVILIEELNMKATGYVELYTIKSEIVIVDSSKALIKY
jgi:hypothetical protein